MNRFGAFLIHLGISLVIFAVLAYVVLYVWYPDFFFASDGGWQGIRIIVMVDLVLGPTLTLVVFNRKKPRRELRRDLSIIGTFQAICLVAGTYIVYMERPLALVYSDGQFFSVSADDYRDAGLPVPDLSGLPGPYPKRVIVELPDDYRAQAEVRQQAIQNRTPLRTLAQYYVPFDYARLDADKEALTAEALQEREQRTGDVSAWLARHGGNIDDYAFFRFGARYQYLILGLSRADGRIVGLMDTDLKLKPANVQVAEAASAR
ncbi:MAG TPA: hypothetical protein VF210_10390 [Pseudomonadales bacterium]